MIDIASVIRSKNAGPFEITLDVIFKSKLAYDQVRASNALSARVISRLYAVETAAPIKITWFEPAFAVKITFPRRVPSGSLGDTDVYGAQHYAPLLSLKLEGVSDVE
ncbi:DUF4387 domain-containing protein [Sinorhizobium meliloti]|uniref:DUF4387 domain-containing protein n=1 Tax=Rhizobium meliloti TaxID=382 RepID=UPI002091B51A|nr:DUF4387 domain-containing protein [Sinorhizobium meliloti]MCO5966750.1 DUF4387 domain-containing protein [Sinorhizobium meliloti]